MCVNTLKGNLDNWADLGDEWITDVKILKKKCIEIVFLFTFSMKKIVFKKTATY